MNYPDLNTLLDRINDAIAETNEKHDKEWEFVQKAFTAEQVLNHTGEITRLAGKLDGLSLAREIVLDSFKG